MKKIFTLSLAATFLIVFSSNAQINKGSVLIGGMLNAYSDNLKNSDSSINKQNNFSISPSIGFATNTNTVIGFSLLYSITTNKGYSFFKTKDNGYGAGIFLRKYKLLSKSFYLFGEGNLLFAYESYNYSVHYAYQAKYDSKAYGIHLDISPGVAYSLTRKLQLEAGLQSLLSLGYTGRKEETKDANYSSFKENTFGLSSLLEPTTFGNIFIGIRLLFNK